MNERQAKELEDARARISGILTYEIEKSVSRPEWGAINFEEARDDLERIFEIVAHLRTLPIEKLPANAVTAILQQLDATLDKLQELDGFSLEGTGSPTQERDQLVLELHQVADRLYTEASPWIPFLAYLRGDVDENIRALTDSVTEAEELVEGAKQNIETKSGEIETIITKAREASAAAGAAVFTKDFKNESDQLGTRAKNWLWATAALGLASLVVAAVILGFPVEGANTVEIVSGTTARIAILAITVGAALWCGRLYKALLHQSTLNRHRALSLQTFQAFSHAAADDATKDAVLLEATRAIFGPGATGFLDIGGADKGNVQVVEVARRLIEGGESTA